MEKVRQYCDWADVQKIDDFFQQAADYVLSKDREWVNHSIKTFSDTNPDRIQGNSDAVSD